MVAPRNYTTYKKSDVFIKKLLALQPCSLTQKIFHGGEFLITSGLFKEKDICPGLLKEKNMFALKMLRRIVE